MSDTTELLNSLRDIQEPLAPQGTSILLLTGNVLLLFAIIGFLLWRSHRRKNAWRRQALQQLKSARTDEQQQSVLRMAKLLRRIALYHDQDCRQTSGSEYLQQLDAVFNTDWFSQGDGQHFGEALYQPDRSHHVDIDALHEQLSSLIRSLPAKQNTSAA